MHVINYIRCILLMTTWYKSRIRYESFVKRKEWDREIVVWELCNSWRIRLGSWIELPLSYNNNWSTPLNKREANLWVNILSILDQSFERLRFRFMLWRRSSCLIRVCLVSLSPPLVWQRSPYAFFPFFFPFTWGDRLGRVNWF